VIGFPDLMIIIPFINVVDCGLWLINQLINYIQWIVFCLIWWMNGQEKGNFCQDG